MRCFDRAFCPNPASVWFCSFCSLEDNLLPSQNLAVRPATTFQREKSGGRFASCYSHNFWSDVLPLLVDFEVYFVFFSSGSETEKDKRKESKREPRARSREREKEKDIAGKLADDDAKPKDMPKSPEKPRFESKFSFLRATPDQIIALEKRKTEQAARDAKAAAIAAQRAAAAAAKLPTRVPTRLGVQSQPGARSGIRQPIRPPEVPAASRSSSASHREESSGSGRSRQSGGTKKDEERKNMPPPTGNPSSSSSSREGNQSRTSSHSRNAEADEGGPERKRMRSVTKESDSKDQRGSSGRSESKK